MNHLQQSNEKFDLNQAGVLPKQYHIENEITSIESKLNELSKESPQAKSTNLIYALLQVYKTHIALIIVSRFAMMSLRTIMPRLVLKFTQFLESQPGEVEYDIPSAFKLMLIEFSVEFVYHTLMKS